MVILIPCIQDYVDAELHTYLWWRDDDFRSFQSSMGQKFAEFVKGTQCTDLKDGLKQFIERELIEAEAFTGEEVIVTGKRSRESDTSIELEKPVLKRIKA